MKKKGRTTLRKKLLAGMIGFALALFFFTSVFVGFYYYRTEMQEYSDTAYSYARTASNLIDGDRVLRYLDPDGPGEDEYYMAIMKYLVSARNENPIMKYFYVFVPHEDDLTYVWDAEGVEGASPLGYTEEYMDGGKEAVDAVFNKEPAQKVLVFNDETYGRISCAYYPIYNSDGEPVAVVGVDLAMEGIEHELMLYFLVIIAAISFVSAVMIIIYYFQLNRMLVKPISELNAATKGLVGNLDKKVKFSLDIHTNDEIEELAGTFKKTNADLRKYIKELSTVTAEKERIGAELNVATRIQADMLPSIFPAFPRRDEFDLFASMSPAKEVGGDFYDFYLIDDDHIALVVADVSGKGVPAALFMVIAKTLIKSRAMLGESPAQILYNVNNQLSEGNESSMFVTVWIAVIQLSTGKGLAANAGHEHPAIRRAGGKYELSVYRHSPAVAMMPGMKFPEHEFELHPGDSLFMYTDGVAEAVDPAYEQFGTDRMLEALNKNPDASPKAQTKAVRAAIDKFVGEAEQFDDITMLCLKYTGPDKKESENSPEQ